MKKKALFTDLSDEQTEKVVGGVGRVLVPGPGAGANGWGGTTPFNPSGNLNAGLNPRGFVPVLNTHSAKPVIVPGK